MDETHVVKHIVFYMIKFLQLKCGDYRRGDWHFWKQLYNGASLMAVVDTNDNIIRAYSDNSQIRVV